MVAKTAEDMLVLVLVLAAIVDRSRGLICFGRGGTTGNTNGSINPTSCPGDSPCRAYIDGANSYAGCGTCTGYEAWGCYTCTTDLCNYYQEITTTTVSTTTASTTSTTTASTTSTTSASTTSTTSGSTVSTAAASAAAAAAVTTTSSSNSTRINCYASIGLSGLSGRTQTLCVGYTNCYSYSYKLLTITYSFSGCGDCSIFTAYANCRTCTTNYCNSAVALARHSDFRTFLTAFAAVVALAVSTRM